MTKKIISLILSALLLFSMIPTFAFAAEGEEPAAIDCVIYAAEDIAVAGNPGDIAGVGSVKNIVNKGLTEDGMVRFGVDTAQAGTAATTSDRFAVKVDNIAFADYPYITMVYKTNINAPQINFNIATAEGTYSSSETKLFGAQTRTVGEMATAKYNYTGSYGAAAKVIGIYAPIYSTTTPAMSTDDYFDIQYIGFFKNADDAAAFDYDAYLASLYATVTFNDKDGVEITSDTYRIGTMVELPEAPAVEGYIFAGWTTGVEDADLITEAFEATEAVTLTAVYEKEPGKVKVFTPSAIKAETSGLNASLKVVEEGEKTYLRFDPTTANNQSAGINWTMAEPLDAAEYNFVKVGYKTNKSDAGGISVQLSMDNTFNWQVKYFEVALWDYWTASSEVRTGEVLFDMTGKAVAAGATTLEFFRILPFSGSVANAISGELYFDIEYVAFFEEKADADAFDFANYVEYTFVFQDINGNVLETKKVAEGAVVALPAAPELKEFTFDGWDNVATQGVVELIVEDFVATEDLTLKAIYSEKAVVKTGGLGILLVLMKLITDKKEGTEAPATPAEPETPAEPTTPAEPVTPPTVDVSGEGIIITGSDLAARCVLEGVDTYNGKEGKLPGGSTVFAAEEGKVRFANSNVGAASTTSDRLIVKVDDINLTAYPYHAIKYNTNIAAENLNFNLTTKDGTYSSSETKHFSPVAREVGKNATAIAKYNGNYGETAVATYVYIPIYSNTSAVVAEGDYFDVFAIGFFATEKEAKEFAK